MASLELMGVGKRYGALSVLKGVDLNADKGEFIVLVGPSGCGKSTLLRMIAGLEATSEGEIRIGGRRVNELPPKDRDIAMVFQSYALYPHMRVRDNMSFALRLARRPKAEIDGLVGRSSHILALDALLERLPRDLSGGQRQRVAMGRAIVRDPKVFLFDEPLSNLDAKLRVQMRAEIKALHQRLGTTIVYVTHDQIEAMTMADRIVVMQSGNVEQVGAPLDLYDRPANEFVATFLGSPAMNMMSAVIGDGAIIDGNGHRWPLPPELGRKAGTRIRLGIRPEDVIFSVGGAPARVELVEPTGAETLVTVSTGANRLILATRERYPIRPGDALFIKAEASRLHIFDESGSQRLN